LAFLPLAIGVFTPQEFPRYRTTLYRQLINKLKTIHLQSKKTMSDLTTTQGVVPFLWFDDRCEEAMNFYTSVFPNSEVKMIRRWGEGSPFPADKIMTGSIEINGLTMHMFDAGPNFKFNESVSFFVNCKNQEEVDHYWNSLTADGGEESMCGWLKDKFGVSWQIVPTMISERLNNSDPVRLGQMMQALWKMRKLDIAELERAYNQ
jgi:predicted 3-demethylubiquinone-9 3-methyltransferase (glyoxalase superfamily)